MSSSSSNRNDNNNNSGNGDDDKDKQNLSSISVLFGSAFVNHVIWSTQTVACRYLQVYAQPTKFDGQTVLATSKAFSFVTLLVLSSSSTCSGGTITDAATTNNSNNRRTGNQDDDDDDVFPSEAEAASASSGEEGTARQTPLLMKKYSVALLFGVVCTLRAALNIASTKFTLSYYITAINSLTPILTSIGDSVILKTKLPAALWPCVVLSCIGCTMIGFSSNSSSPNTDDDDAESDGNSNSFTKQDVIGCGLQFASMCFSAAARLLMKATSGVLTKTEAVQTNNICNIIFPVLYTTILYNNSNPDGGGSPWTAFYDMTFKSFMAWVVVAVLVYTIGSMGQMSLVRKMGPGMYSSLGGIRVICSAFLSAICLNEPVTNWLEWFGLILLVVTMTVYTLTSVGINMMCSGSSSSSNWLQQRRREEIIDGTSDDDGDVDMQALIPKPGERDEN